MVGQSFDVAVFALIEAPSTADVTALMCSGEPLVCASTPVQEIASPKPIASAVCASRAGLCILVVISGKKRQAESTRGERVISSPPSDLSRICRDGIPAKRMASIKGGGERKKRKFVSPCFRQTECIAACGLRCGI